MHPSVLIKNVGLLKKSLHHVTTVLHSEVYKLQSGHNSYTHHYCIKGPGHIFHKIFVVSFRLQAHMANDAHGALTKAWPNGVNVNGWVQIIAIFTSFDGQHWIKLSEISILQIIHHPTKSTLFYKKQHYASLNLLIDFKGYYTQKRLW